MDRFPSNSVFKYPAPKGPSMANILRTNFPWKRSTVRRSVAA